jgi:NADH dehydrogenase FAD-containing subunit
VVIIGSGFGGLFAARALKRAPVRITLIDRTNHHLFQPLLYQVATGILSEGQIAPAIRDVLRNYPALRVILGEVEDIDIDSRDRPRRRVRQADHHQLRQPHRRRRGVELLLRSRRVPRRTRVA